MMLNETQHWHFYDEEEGLDYVRPAIERAELEYRGRIVKDWS